MGCIEQRYRDQVAGYRRRLDGASSPDACPEAKQLLYLPPGLLWGVPDYFVGSANLDHLSRPVGIVFTILEVVSRSPTTTR